MYGIFSLLDADHSQRLAALLQDLSAQCGIGGEFQSLLPHFSWHVAADYHLERLEPALAELSSCTQPFYVRTTGLGVFTGPSPVLYLSIVKNDFLVHFHQRLWDRAQPEAVEPSPLYSPESWVPHITLAHGDVDQAKLGCAVSQLAFQMFQWEFQVDHLALGYAASTDMSKLIKRFPFQG